MSTRAELSQACKQVAGYYDHQSARQEQRTDRQEYQMRASLIAKAATWLESDRTPRTNASEYQQVIEALQKSAFDWLSVEGAPGFAEWGRKLDEAVVVLHNMPRICTPYADLQALQPRPGALSRRVALHPGGPLHPVATVQARRAPPGPVVVAETPVPMEHEADEVRDEEEI